MGSSNWLYVRRLGSLADLVGASLVLLSWRGVVIGVRPSGALTMALFWPLDGEFTRNGAMMASQNLTFLSRATVAQLTSSNVSQI